ncbi:UNVERIFIED_CONTAM: hypothetical protein GTU68_045673 [Idotea baltica]|nr:hypothetical protein [Idotea baltica]
MTPRKTIGWSSPRRHLTSCRIQSWGTGTTAARDSGRLPDAPAQGALKSGPLGRDQQIGAMIAEGKLQGADLLFVGPAVAPGPRCRRKGPGAGSPLSTTCPWRSIRRRQTSCCARPGLQGLKTTSETTPKSVP